MSTHHDDVSGDVDGLTCDECGARLLHFTGGAPVVSSSLESLRAWSRGDAWRTLRLEHVHLDREGVDLCSKCLGLDAVIALAAKQRQRIRELERYVKLLEAFIDGQMDADGAATGAP